MQPSADAIYGVPTNFNGVCRNTIHRVRFNIVR